MQHVNGNKKLCELAIPGTHDSHAYNTPHNIGECHDWNIQQQLERGIRFFDIRLSNSRSKWDFLLRHGRLRLGSFKRLVMIPVTKFLIANPSETVIMSIKPEGGHLSIGRLQHLYIKNPTYKFFQGVVTRNTKLNKVRGKIVLFRRYSGWQNIGLRWGHDMSIQDEYNLHSECRRISFWWVKKRICSPLVGLDYPRKARTVINFLHTAVRGFGSRFYIDFASANWKGAYIGNSAKVSNRALLGYFRSHKTTKVGCIIPMDYPNRVHWLIWEMLHNNFSRR